MNALRIADYVFIEFGHNDENTGGGAYTPPADYKTNLIKFVTETRAKQAIPVLITPVSRRSFSGNTATQTHPIYSPIVRSVAAEQNVILVDLDALSISQNQQYGPEGSKALYMWLSPGRYPNYPSGLSDNTHFQVLGARKVADLVLGDLTRMGSELAAYQLGAVPPPSPPPPPPPPPSTLLDVIVTSLSYASGVFTSTVKNQGAAATPAGIAIGVGYSVDGVSRTWGAVSAPPLAAGASATVGSDGGPYTIPNGTHTIMAHVDDANRFAESNETNNQLSQTITVGGTDTTPPTVSITAPANGATVSGSSVTISATSSDNVGVSALQFKLDGANFGDENPSSPSSVTWNTTTATNGSHTITTVARDAAGNTTTSAGVSVTVSNGTPPPPSPSILPDVIVTSLSYASGVFTSTVKNQGAAATPAGIAIGVGYSVDGVSKTWGGLGVPPIAAGASVTIGTNGGPYTIPSGTHTIMAHVDDVNRFAESNETNNQLSQTTTVGGTPSSPTAAFNANPTSGTAPMTVTFTDTSTGNITTWSWNFGDGTTSTATNAAKTYTNPGSYTVGLAVTGPAGSNTATRTISVAAAAPVANFTATPISGTTPLAVTFTNSSSGTVSGYSWSFGDGGTSTTPNPAYTYTKAGTYSVSLKATGPGGTNTKTQNGYITVSSGLVGAYNFEEASGTTVVDASGRGNKGTISGAARITQGRFGKALSFDGVDDWVTVNDSVSLDLTTGMTLEAWVYPTVDMTE